MKNNVILSFISSFFMLSCSSNYLDLPTPEFKDSVTLKSEIVVENLMYTSPYQTVIVDSSFLFVEVFGTAVASVDLPTKSCKGVLLHRGRGPKEFINPSYVGQNPADSTVSFYQLGGDIKTFKWSKPNGYLELELISSKKPKSDHYMPYDIIQLANGYYFGTIQTETDAFCTLYNKDLKQIGSMNYNPFTKSVYSPSVLQTRNCSYNNRVVSAFTQIGYVASYLVDDSGGMTLDWQMAISPIYEPSDMRDVCNLNKQGCCDVKITSKYIYLGYSGNLIEYTASGEIKDPYGYRVREMLVLTHSGETVLKMKIPEEISLGRFYVMPDNSAIYGYHSILEQVVKFDLKGILN